MTRIAATGEVELLATCGAAAILEMPELRDSGTIDGLLLNTLLVPAGPRMAPEPFEVRFAHRAYQEYFLSRYVRSNPETFAVEALPDAIREWMKD